MRNISDNELDKLFQDAAQRIEPEFDPGDWDKLSKRIDRSERVNLFKRIAIYLSLALLLIFSTWLGITYYQGQSDTNNDSVGNRDTSIEKDHVVNGDSGNSKDTNTSAEDAGVDADNGTSTGSLSEGAPSSASLNDQQREESSSASNQIKSSSDSHADAEESKDIVPGQKRSAAIASSTTDQAAEQNTSKSNNAQRKSDFTAQNKSTSAHTKDQNTNTVNKSAERTAVANDQQSIQKQERTVAGEKKRDEGSLSASGNSKNQALASNQQNKNTVKVEQESSQKNASAQNEKPGGQSEINTASTEGAGNNKQKGVDIASDKPIVPSTSTSTLASGEKEKSVDSNSDTITSGNAGAVGKNNSVTLSDTKVNAINQSGSSDRTNTNTTTPSSRLTESEKSGSDSSSDSSAIANARAKNSTALKDTNVSGNKTAVQSDNAIQTIAGSDSLSAVSATKSVSAKSAETEKTDAVVLDDPSVKKSASEEDSLKGRTPADKNVYSDSKGIAASDTVLADNDRTSLKNKDAGKTAGGIENANVQPVIGADRVVSGSDTLSSKIDSQQKTTNAAATSDKNENILLPVKKDEAPVKSADGNKAGIANQTASPATDIAADSVSNQVSANETAREKSNAIAANDSTLAKPVAKADSLGHAADNKEAAEEEREEDRKSKESNWYVKLLVSPDFSSIGYNKPGKTGFNIGLAVEYSPSKHWGFSTGAIWSKKLYDKNNPGKAYSYGGTSFEADYLDGDCRVLDIPINITYYILPEARLNFYATVGVSSYIMLEENYVYTVTENNNNYYYYEDYKNENRHWFSMLNLSFGVQYRISPRLQLQAEPFLKAPMSGVGQGKIDLVSAGTFFTLKYKIK